MLGSRRCVYKKSVVFCRIVQVKFGERCESTLVGANNPQGKTGSHPPVADFYAGKSVFLTGGTGFLGKVFIEKLLYSCDHLENIYMLIREKRGTTINDRMEEMFQNPLFSRLRNHKPEYLKKVIPVTGDITLPNLGIKPEDEETLIEKVSVVFNSAATVALDDPMPVAMNVNFEGTKKVLQLCKLMKKIQVFAHISTAYTHTHIKILEETLYPPPADVNDVYKFIEKHGYDEKETKKFIGTNPNTYAFTKALSEAYIAENHGDVPTIIIRPSIVGPHKEEPVKGWLDNWQGATVILHYTGIGWNRVSLGRRSHVIDFIPVDYVCNLTILAAARHNKPKEIDVFNSCTSFENPVKQSDALNSFIIGNISSGQNEAPYPFHIFTESRAVLKISTIILQMAPAYIADLFLRIRGRKPKYVKLQAKLTEIRDILAFYMLRSWVMKSTKARELSSTLSSSDKVQFPCDPTQIRWDEYMKDYCHGVHTFLIRKNKKY